MPAHEALEISNYHFYRDCWELFFGNTVYRLLFSFCLPLFLLFHHPSTSCLFVYSPYYLVSRAIISAYCSLPPLLSSLLFHHHGVGILSLHLQHTQNGAAKKEMNVWRFSWSEVGPSCQKHKKNEFESVIESMQDK